MKYFYFGGSLKKTTHKKRNYKNWLITGQMNFYLAAIPGYITANIPAGKHLHDFNVAEMSCLCCFAPNTPDNPYNIGEYAIELFHGYWVTSGEDVPAVHMNNAISLPMFGI